MIEKLSDLQITTLILGDLNFPDINWMKSTFKTNGIDDVFFNGMSLLGMNQFVCDPTRMSKFNNNNILDLIFSNDPLSVHIADHLAPLSTSDHHVIEFFIFPTSSHNNVTTDMTPPLPVLDYSYTSGPKPTLSQLMINSKA